MAVVSGTVHSVRTLVSRSVSEFQLVEILFTVSGTYAQADNAILTGVAALIKDSRRDGKTLTLVDVVGGTPATKDSDPTQYLYCKGAAISTNDITFEIANNSPTTEFTDATAVPSQSRPFALWVVVKE